MSPQNFGLLGMAGAMLRPGGNLGDGFTAYQQGLGQGQQMQSQQLYQQAMRQNLEAQAEERRLKAQAAQQQAEARRTFQGMFGVGQDPAQPSGVDPAMPGLVLPRQSAWTQEKVAAGIAAGYTVDQLKAMAESGNMGRAKVARTADVTGPGGLPQTVQLDDYGGRVGEAMNKPFELRSTSLDGTQINQNPFTGQQVGPALQRTPFGHNADGSMTPGYQRSKAAVAAAGATNLNVNAGKDLASQVGDIMKSERTGVEGAIQLGQSADQLERALDSGRVISGPMASGKIQLLQVGKALNITGKSADEILMNTRQAIRSLAQMDVQARKQLEGQGQVTETEARAVAKAEGGNIDEMTEPELRLLVGLTRKVTAYKASQYKSRLQSVPQELRPFYEIPGLDRFSQPPQGPTDIPALLEKYGR